MTSTDTKPTVFLASSSTSMRFAHAVAHELEPYARPLVWSESHLLYRSPVTSELLGLLRRSDFAVCLLDAASLQQRERGPRVELRPGMLFELGLMVGALGPDRLLIVALQTEGSSVRLPTDLVGLQLLTEVLPEADRHGLEIIAQRTSGQIRRALARLEPKPEQAVSSYSCFIGYVREDQRFANRLFEDLTDLGVRCWLDTRELRVGDSIHDRIAAGLRASDKMLAILSHHAVSSPWFKTEVDIAMGFEQQRAETVVFPIRLDDSVLESSEPLWRRIAARHIADFTDWVDPRSYRRAFATLARALTLSAATEGSAQ